VAAAGYAAGSRGEGAGDGQPRMGGSHHWGVGALRGDVLGLGRIGEEEIGPFGLELGRGRRLQALGAYPLVEHRPTLGVAWTMVCSVHAHAVRHQQLRKQVLEGGHLQPFLLVRRG